MEQKKKIPMIMASYFIIYMMMSGQFNYLSLFLAAKGLTTSQIGMLLGLPPFVAIAGQYFWNGLADKASSMNKIFLIVFTGAVAVLPLYLISSSVVGYLIAIVLYNVFSTSILCMFDTLNLYRASEMGYRFGPLKMPGSLGFLVCIVSLGFLLDINVDFLIWWQLLFGIIGILVLPLCPKVKMPKMKKAVFNPMVMLRQPAVLLALLIACVIHFIHGVNSSFFAIFIVKEMGATSSFAGICSIGSIAVELGFLLICDKLVQRFSIKTLLFSVGVLQAVRLLAFGMADNLAVIFLFNCVDGISTVATYFFMVHYFKRVAPDEGKASSQALVSILCSSCARALGSMSAPLIFSAMGSIQHTYIALAIVMAAAAMIFIVTPIHFITEDEI